MVEIQVAYDGGLRCTAVHQPSGSTLRTDAPKDNQGRGELFSPTDLVATALGTCMLTIMGIVAQRKGIELTGARARVVKEMAAVPMRQIGALTVEFDLPAGLSPEQQQMLEHAAHTCPVHRSLAESVRINVTFNWTQTNNG